MTSTEGQGSTFTVAIPLGKAHLDANRIDRGSSLGSTAVGHAAFVEEALRWLPEEAALREDPVGVVKSRILWADDNADMRA